MLQSPKRYGQAPSRVHVHVHAGCVLSVLNFQDVVKNSPVLGNFHTNFFSLFVFVALCLCVLLAFN